MTAASDVRFTFIMPTCGRYSLKAAALSAMTQFEPGDSLYIVSDGPVDGVKETAAALGVAFIEGPKTGHWGNEQRNLLLDKVALGEIPGTHLVFLDDDDRLVPRVLKRVRERVAQESDKLFLFRFLAPYRIAIWRNQKVEQGNCGTGNIVVPVGPWLGRYGDRYEGDFDFIVDTLNRMKAPPVFSPLYLQCAQPQPGDCEGLRDLNERIVA
jgi:hypothetical protein